MENKYAMNSPSIDEILSKLSAKFNKIFCDREFVCCVNEDFQVVLKNKNKCVVVFPVLGPNYLKAVRYQAKIFDLAVFVLGAGRTRSVAVCQKEFLKKNCEMIDNAPEQIMPESASESGCSKLKKKRPERQLYIPPAQRRLPLTKKDSPEISEKYHNTRNKTQTYKKKENGKITVNRHSTAKDLGINGDKHYDFESGSVQEQKREVDVLDSERCIQISETAGDICVNYLPRTGSVCILWKYQISKDSHFTQFQYFFEYISYLYFKYYHYFTFYKRVPLYSCECSSNFLYILRNDYALWQPRLDIIYLKSDNFSANSMTYPLYSFEETSFVPNESVFEVKLPLADFYDIKLVYDDILKNYDSSKFRTFKVLWNKNECIFSENDFVVDLSVVNCGHTFVINSRNGCDYWYSCEEDHNVIECYLDKKRREDHESKLEICNSETSKISEGDEVGLTNGNIIILEERFSSEAKNEVAVQKNNIKNTTTNSNITANDVIDNMNSNKIIQNPKKSNEHEQEKEIMRKAKEHINRRTRPIMKYVDDASDTLKIDKNDNVNNWEDLFDDDGQLQEELFKEITHKVGTDVTIVKAKEDYSDYSEYVVKQSEDLEHMVELYDFPSTLGTHDIIQAFSDINSDAMYVKWVDDTHAILVLGSLKQAQRAIELDNPLIKARPMTAASGMSLATAYKHDLKPAMKRPQTNLQTARRLITTHLGTKSKVSREQSAKEKNDLKVAREMKKLVKKNEQDAWEGSLRSSTN